MRATLCVVLLLVACAEEREREPETLATVMGRKLFEAGMEHAALRGRQLAEWGVHNDGDGPDRSPLHRDGHSHEERHCVRALQAGADCDDTDRT